MTSGERWTREALVDLRAAGYAPRAWAVFLLRSRARARERRDERPREHRQALGLGAAGITAWAGAAVAGHPPLAAAGALWWVLVVLMVDWHLGMLERADGAPVCGLGLANVLTVLRAGTVPALLALDGTALVILFLLAGLTDGVDGRFARARGETTRLGFWLDATVDGIFLGAAALGLARAGLLPGWAATLVVVRYALPWVVVSVAYFRTARPPDLRRAVSGRLPGLLLFSGLVLAGLGMREGAALAAFGALAGLATLAVSIARAYALADSAA